MKARAKKELAYIPHSLGNILHDYKCLDLVKLNLELLLCYDLPWTGLLASGDNGCHRWMAVGVRVTPLGRYNNNRMTWEQSCQEHDMDTRQMDTRHMLPD